MLNHFNFKRFNKGFLITNDFGKYLFLSNEEFQKYLSDNINKEDELYQVLKSKYFILESKSDLLADDKIHAIREIKNYLFGSTSLHIFAVTNACNLSCIYCQAKDKSSLLGGFMSPEIGKKAVGLALQSPCQDLTFEFQGGEPLLNFGVIKDMIEECERTKGEKRVQYTMVSNLLALTDDKLEYLAKYNVKVSTSLDGPRNVQEFNRRMKIPGSSYDIVCEQYKKLQKCGIGGGAIETTTRYSLKYAREIVDEYLNIGMKGIFIRPLTPLGFAKADWDQIGYTPEEFLVFYKEAFNRILEINKEGTVFPEFLATYFLKKILQGYSFNYMELRSPCGAVTGQLSYYYDGSVYTCDEGRMVSEMGDCAFKLGTVENSYDEIIESPVCKVTQAASVIESLPGCSDCVYQPYCGVCPVVTYAMDKDIFPRGPKGFRCKVYMGIQDFLFGLIEDGNDETMKILNSWIME